MKYAPIIYAKALADVVSRKLSPAESAKILKNFLAVVEKNGDLRNLKKIVAHAEKIIRERTGSRKIVVSS